MEQKSIFLIEDNADDEALTLRGLKKCNITNEIIVARDGVEALDRLFRTGEYKDNSAVNPSVILLDLKLPKIDGLEVLQRLRENEETKLIPVVVLTSSGEQEDIIRSYDLGANSYVRKPVEFSQFFEAINQLGSYWSLLNEIPE